MALLGSTAATDQGGSTVLGTVFGPPTRGILNLAPPLVVLVTQQWLKGGHAVCCLWGALVHAYLMRVSLDEVHTCSAISSGFLSGQILSLIAANKLMTPQWEEAMLDD